MMIIVTFLFSFTHARGFQCMHGHLPRPIQIKELNDTGRRLSSAWRNPSQGRSFRVFFETFYLEHLTPGVSCTTASDWVNHSGSNWPCHSVDMFTPQQKQAVLDTFENLRTFIYNTMKVIPIEACIADGRFVLYGDGSHYPAIDYQSDGQTDLYITIYPRPFAGSLIIANADVVRSLSETWGRPVQGFIDLNMAYAPTVGQSSDTEGDREFFNVALHELSHVLGTSQDLFERWINPNTGQAYGWNLPLYTIPTGPGHVNKAFTILHTPKIHSVLSERWGYEYFNNNPSWPVGVEIEDSGGSRTVGSHWEGRTHHTDYMTGTSFGYSYISKLSLAALEDTGWYSINMTRAEPIAWGNWRSIQGASSTQFQNFALGAPALSWPKHYVPRSYTEMQRMQCTFDHKAVFSPSGFGRRVCSSSTTGQCQHPGFHDATNIGYYGEASLDYSLIAYPLRICANQEDYDSSIHAGSSYGTNSMCARTKLSEGTYSRRASYIGECYRMECPGYGILRIWIGSNSQYVDCTEANQTKTVAGYSGDVECPDLRIVCGIKRFDKGLSNEHHVNPIVRTRSRTKSPSPSPTQSQSPSPTKSQTSSFPPIINISVNGCTPVESTVNPITFRGNGIIHSSDDSPLKLRHITIFPGSNITAVHLQVLEYLLLFGDARLSALAGDTINFGANVNIIIESVGNHLPQLSLGGVSDPNRNVPSIIDISISVNAFSSSSLESFHHNLVLGEDWLECELWRERVKFKDPSNFTTICETNSSGQLLTGVTSLVVIRKNPQETDARGITPAVIILFMVIFWVLVLLVGIVIALIVQRHMEKHDSPSASSEALGVEARQASVTAGVLSDSVDSRNFSPGKHSRYPGRISLPEKSLDLYEEDNGRTRWSTERASPYPENWPTRNLLRHPQNRSTQGVRPHPEDQSDCDTPWFSARLGFY